MPRTHWPPRKLHYRECARCGTTFQLRQRTATQRYCGSPCAYEHRKELKLGQRRVRADGYVLIYVNDEGWAREHRWIAAQRLGRPLQPGESVHHINGDRADNRPENLQVRASAHGSGVALACGNCGSTNVVHVPLQADITIS